MGCQGSASCLHAYAGCECVHTDTWYLCACARTHKMDPRKKIITSQNTSGSLSQTIMLDLGVGRFKKCQIVIIHQQSGFLVHEELALKILLRMGPNSRKFTKL